jgi:hypothetical protein
MSEMGSGGTMVFRSGERIQITYDCNTIDGKIFFACPTGLNVTVSFSGSLGKHAGLMPLRWIEDHYVEPFNGRFVMITRLDQTSPWNPARDSEP